MISPLIDLSWCEAFRIFAAKTRNVLSPDFHRVGISGFGEKLCCRFCDKPSLLSAIRYVAKIKRTKNIFAARNIVLWQARTILVRDRKIKLHKTVNAVL